MNSVLDIILFIVTTFLVMLIIQAYRVARFIKNTAGDEYDVSITTFVVMFVVPKGSGGLLSYYAKLLSGYYLSSLEKPPVVKEDLDELPQEVRAQNVENIDKELHLMREYFYPNIAKVLLTTSKDVREFRRAAESLVNKIVISEDLGDRHSFIARVDKQMDVIALIENMSREEVCEMFSRYMLNLDEKFIQRKIKELNIN